MVTPELQEQFRTFARLKGVLDPLWMVVGERFAREEIPGLFNGAGEGRAIHLLRAGAVSQTPGQWTNECGF
ncbi:hypothetical protein CKO35_15010 [Ectothiorhodospira shaposhnikovii]|uniref:hypothetical protein n=1 Tax=Ectothiorhodospira shaposhnikovii TaxID=1054 RepID=UPI0019065D36|nr:hypothetical protein [Ectothiorhodospira shaposhnikovii]MBK1674578.1 hypothetical protein [Ectothiorhodospira shaposhnikovii]